MSQRWAKNVKFAALARCSSPRLRIICFGELESCLMINSPFASMKDIFASSKVFSEVNLRPLFAH